MFINKNLNPLGKQVGDCVIRAISKFVGQSWDVTFWGLANTAFNMADMMSSNAVWGKYLQDLGYKRHSIPDYCPICYTVADFCKDYPNGRFLLGTGQHAIAVIDGNHYDTWDSSGETVLMYFS